MTEGLTAKIGFVWNTAIGFSMCRRLVEKLPNATFSVWNYKKEEIHELQAKYGGIKSETSPLEVTKHCDVVFCMLNDIESSYKLLEDLDGVIMGVTEGKFIVDCTCTTPERVLQVAQLVHDKGGKFLEAPVSGSQKAADLGLLVFFCGEGLSSQAAQEEYPVYKAVSKALDAMGKRSIFFGAAGQGTKVKLIIHMIMGAMMTSFSEGLLLAAAAEVNVDKLLHAINYCAICCPLFEKEGIKMVKGEFADNFPLKHAQRDMSSALTLGKQLGLFLPTIETASEEFEKVIEEVGEEKDFASIHALDRRLILKANEKKPRLNRRTLKFFLLLGILILIMICGIRYHYISGTIWSAHSHHKSGDISNGTKSTNKIGMAIDEGKEKGEVIKSKLNSIRNFIKTHGLEILIFGNFLSFTHHKLTHSSIKQLLMKEILGRAAR